MIKCRECGDWLDQASPDGDLVCDECWGARIADQIVNARRKHTIREAKAKQMLAKYDSWSLIQNSAKAHKTSQR